MSRLPFVLAILASCVGALPVWAAPARVLSGEHDGFTRLVVELDSDLDWTVGRTADGYGLKIAGPANDFDLTGAFDLIGRSRIAALSADPVSGSLLVAVGCNCHVSPFEFRPGTIVLDFKDGSPPAESPYELALDTGSPDSVSVLPDPAKGAGAADKDAGLASAWIDAALGLAPVAVADAGTGDAPPAMTGAQPAPTMAPEPMPEPMPGVKPDGSGLPISPLMDPGLSPLRETLMQEISRGAATGVVSMTLPEDSVPTGPMNPESPGDPDQARVGLGALAALPQVKVEGIDPKDLSPQGAQCPNDVQLDAASWGDARPVWEQLSEARNNLVGEFDRPDAESVSKAMKFHIFIGFGQEAIAIVDSMGTSDRDLPLWRSMARILDEVPDPDPAFDGMQGCDSAAALWAVLAQPDLQAESVNLPALQRAFSALPAGLRQILGPRLIERLMAMGQTGAVNVITNAIHRAGISEDRAVALATAEVAAEAGAFDQADDLLQPLLADPGPQTAEALVAKIDGAASRSLPLTEQDLQQISAYAAEREGGPQSAEFKRALILAKALTGDFAGSFALAPDDSALWADLWRILADLGTDDAILEMATVLSGQPAPAEADLQAPLFAERFLRLGLPDQARQWANRAKDIDPLLAAEIALANRDGLLALTYLQGVDSEQAKSMQIAAKILTGDDQSAAADLARGGDVQGAAVVLARARDWAALGEEGPPAWQSAAMALNPAAPPLPAGPLAEGLALADQAQETSAALRALLAAVPPVENPAP